MLQPQLPSGRRRLLLLIIFVFTIVVFATRYLLVTLGWVGQQAGSTPQTKQEKQQVTSNQPTTLTAKEIQEAKQVAESFIQRYTHHDLSQSKTWFQSFVKDLHPDYAEEVRLEAERSRPTVIVQKTLFKGIKRSTCDPTDEQVRCHLEVTIETIDQQQQGILMDKVYEVITSRQNGNWKVEGLNIYGSLD